MGKAKQAVVGIVTMLCFLTNPTLVFSDDITRQNIKSWVTYLNSTDLVEKIDSILNLDKSILEKFGVFYYDKGGSTINFKPDQRNNSIDIREIDGRLINLGHLANLLFNECILPYGGVGIGEFDEFGPNFGRGFRIKFTADGVSTKTEKFIISAHEEYEKKRKKELKYDRKTIRFAIICTTVNP